MYWDVQTDIISTVFPLLKFHWEESLCEVWKYIRKYFKSNMQECIGMYRQILFPQYFLPVAAAANESALVTKAWC